MSIKSYVKNNKVLFFFARHFIDFLKKLLGLHNRRSFLYRTIKNKLIKKEINIIKNFKEKKISIVFDCKVSPMTYGDFFNVAMGVRYFYLKKFKVNFFIINDTFRDVDWNTNKGAANNRIKEFKEILLNTSNLKNIEVLSWKKFENKKNIFNENILFKERIKKRKYTYGYFFNFLNEICKNDDNSFLQSFLLDKNSFSGKFPTSKYITVHCRHKPSNINDYLNNRNLKPEEFIKLIRTLKEKYYNHDLLVISDETGCKYFSQIDKKNNLNVLYSYNFGKNFIEHGNLVLHSDHYYQLWSGGICVFTYYSKTPYLRCTSTLNNEIPNKQNQLAFWHNENSYLIENDRRDDIFFYKRLKKIFVN